MKRFWKKKWNVVLYLFLLFLTFYFAMLAQKSGEHYKFEQYESLVFEQPWKYEFSDGTSGKTDLPTKLDAGKSSTLILTNTLPDMREDVSFIYRARHVTIKIYLNDELVYDQLADGRGPVNDTPFLLPGNVWNELRLNPSNSGQKITVVSNGDIQRYLTEPGEIYLGDRASFLLALLKSKGGTIVGATILIIISIMLFALWIILTYSTHAKYKECLCLSLFTMSVGLWEYTETRSLQFVLDNMKAPTILAFELLALSPVPIALYFTYGKRKRTEHAARIAAVIPLVVWMFNNALHFLHIADLADTIKLTQGMIAFETIFIGGIQIYDLVVDKRTHGKDYGGVFWWVPLLGLGMLAPLLLVEVLKYMLDSSTSYFRDDALLPTLGIIFYIVSLAIHSGLKLASENFMVNESNKAKSQFLANMSHEIRTPLNAILGFDELILRDAKEDTTHEKVLEYASSIQNAGESLRDIINTVLDLSKIESGKLELDYNVYHTVQLIDNVASLERALAERKGLYMKMEVDEKLPEQLVGDEARIRQVLVNLMTNAVKYTKKGGVTFRVKLVEYQKEEKTCDILFMVSDTGIGIREEDKERLFEKFERLDFEQNKNTEGTGLGMSIVVKLLEAMGSKIHLDSVYGKGSDFSFVLRQKVADESCVGVFEENKNKRETRQSEMHYVAPAAKVLIVDDVQLNIKVACGLLANMKMQIDAADSGKAAIELVQQNRYDVILMDHMMPEMDGIVATKHIRELSESTGDEYYKNVPILALTANALVGMREMFLQEGLQDFISKPVRQEVLEKALLKWLPKEKIISAEAYVEEGQAPEKQGKNTKTSSIESQEWTISIPGVDLSVARQFFTDEASYKDTLYDFYMAIPDMKEQIETYMNAQDIENYTIKVHGLKSSAKLIGAMELSEMAKRLEEYGHKELLEPIEKGTPELLEQYGAVAEALTEYFGKQMDSKTEVIDKEKMMDILSKLKTAAENFDMNEFLNWEKRVKSIEVPQEYQKSWEKVKKAVQNVEFTEAVDCIEEIIKQC